MGRRFVRDLSDGENVDEIYLATDKQLRHNRNGNLYLQVELRDRTGTVTSRLWNASEHLFQSFDVGDFLLIRGKVQLFQGALQMILNHFEKVEREKVNLAEFLPHTEHDISKLFERFRTVMRRIANPHIRALVECFLMDEEFVQMFCRVPAGVRHHHAYVGGLLEHVVALLEAADRILPLYPKVDRDLLLAGVFLHDVGKVRELTCEHMLAYSDEGQLIGHIIIGVEMLNEKAAKAQALTGESFPTELLLRLKHMIASHHGTYEFGSPRLPMTLEAIVLHYLDNLDAKAHLFDREIRDDRNMASSWTPFIPSIDRRIFKGLQDGREPRYSPTVDSAD